MKRLADLVFTKLNGPWKKNNALFETLDIFNKFMYNTHHNCHCKAVINLTFQ